MCDYPGSGEHVDQAVGRAVAVEQVVEPVAVGGRCGAAGEHGPLVLGERGLGVAGVCGEGIGEFGAVEHGQVGAFAVRQGEVGGVADQGHPRHPVPPVFEEWLGADDFNTLEYYGALRTVRTSWQPERDAASWIRFCLTAHHLQAQEVQRRFEAASRVWFRLERLAEQHRLGERTVSALDAATEGHLRRTTYQAEEALTRDQALADLRTLRSLDLIESVGHARTQRYIGGTVLQKIRTEVHAEVHADLYREPYPQP